jgi:hypothetical protein
MIGYTGFLGPTCYAIISETSSTRLRNKTLAFARMCYSIQGIVFNILNAYMINPTAFGWQGWVNQLDLGTAADKCRKTAFFWAPCAALSAVWCWYRLPELKDRCESCHFVDASTELINSILRDQPSFPEETACKTIQGYCNRCQFGRGHSRTAIGWSLIIGGVCVTRPVEWKLGKKIMYRSLQDTHICHYVRRHEMHIQYRKRQWNDISTEVK